MRIGNMKTVNEYANLASDNFKLGYNCCQSVVLAFEDLLDIDKDTLARLTSGFGAGMGKMREVCGAVSGMFMVASILKGYNSPTATVEKVDTYAMIMQLGEEFKKEFGTIICRELLNLDPDGNPVPSERTPDYYTKRPCADMCKECARILAEYLTK